ncbi:hypothetical protein BD779DRAFT_1469864 [Infundibulicybe gibba]|nr:hypothetical protein BD779DRAFT_1469864 [Infundibulicybe gibba]
METESLPLLRTSYLPTFAPQSYSLTENEPPTILGGNSLLLKDNETWPRCPKCEEPLVPLLHLPISSPTIPQEFQRCVSTINHSLNTYLQFLACSDMECFESTVIQDECAWLLRMISSTAPDMRWIASSADFLLGPVAIAGGEETGTDWFEVHCRLREEGLFRPQSVVIGWREAKLETFDSEDLWQFSGVTDEYREEHAPLDGLKLLGHPVKGKFKCGSWGGGCPLKEPHCEWRNLVQLGSGSDDIQLVETLGNCWVMQCDKHPEQLAFGLSGNW